MIFPPPPIGWVGSEANLDREPTINALAQLYRDIWKEIHTKQDPDEVWFGNLLSRVPNGDCGCFAWLSGYIKTNPPRFNDWFVWTWELHNAVNRKLNKPEITLDEAKAIWLTNKQP